MYTRPILQHGESLVNDRTFRFGTFDSPFERVNMLDVHKPFHYPIPRWLKWMRVKEWQAFQVGNADFFMFAVLFNAKLFSMAFFSFWDRAERKKYMLRHLLPAGLIHIPSTLTSSAAKYDFLGFSMDALGKLDENHVVLDLSIRDKRDIKSLEAEISLNHSPKAAKPIVTCMPLGMNRAVYTHKAMMPASGSLIMNGKEFLMSEDDTIGIMDFHKGYYPFQMEYDWVTGFGHDAKGRRIGFNLTDNQVKDQYSYNENCLWIDANMFPLPPVKITRPAGLRKTWNIQDTEGMVDLTFEPETMNSLSVNGGLFAADFNGPFGSFSGTIVSPKGTKIDCDQLYGMGEKQYLRI